MESEFHSPLYVQPSHVLFIIMKQVKSIFQTNSIILFIENNEFEYILIFGFKTFILPLSTVHWNQSSQIRFTEKHMPIKKTYGKVTTITKPHCKRSVCFEKIFAVQPPIYFWFDFCVHAKIWRNNTIALTPSIQLFAVRADKKMVNERPQNCARSQIKSICQTGKCTQR